MYKNISPKEAKLKLKKDSSLVWIDVRTPEEHAEKRIPKTILIPLDTIDENITDKLKDKKANILLHCRTGRRSKKACERLGKLGYTNLSNMDGGIEAWPYEVEHD